MVKECLHRNDSAVYFRNPEIENRTESPCSCCAHSPWYLPCGPVLCRYPTLKNKKVPPGQLPGRYIFIGSILNDVFFASKGKCIIQICWTKFSCDIKMIVHNECFREILIFKVQVPFGLFSIGIPNNSYFIIEVTAGNFCFVASGIAITFSEKIHISFVKVDDPIYVI